MNEAEPFQPRTSECQLIARAIRGEESAFTELFEVHKNHVYSLCLRMTANVAEAEDLTQETFMLVFRKLVTFRGKSALSTWIYRVAVNTVLMRLRKKALHPVSLEEKLDQDGLKHNFDLSQHDRHLRGTIDRLALVRAISELPPGYRTVFLLHEVEGYGHEELARLLGCTVGNTKSQLHKARLRIRELMLGKKPVEEAALLFGVTEVGSSSVIVPIASEKKHGREYKGLPTGSCLRKTEVPA